MAYHYSNRQKKILILSSYAFLVLVFFICVILKPQCLLKTFFHIPCPSCGMTRAAKELLKFNIIGSFSYNILAFPIALFLLYIFVLTIFNSDTKKVEKVITTILEHYYLVIALIIISWIVNIYRGI